MRRGLLDLSSGYVEPVSTTTSVAQAAQPSQGFFTLAILVVLGICILTGVAWIVIRMIRKCRKPPLVDLSVTNWPQEPRHRLSLLQTSTPDVARGPANNPVLRSESMVQRASAWAQSVLSGHGQPEAPIENVTRVPKQICSIPVKHAIVILQPDGLPSLAVTEAQQKDAQVQVGGLSSTRLEINDQRDLHRTESGCQTLISLSRASSAADLDDVPAGSRRGNYRLQSGDACGADSREDESSSVIENTQGREDRRRNRRRRKRRQGTCEASCQTE